ncbi:tetratricopeptide repeat protein [Sphingobium nicotianae]|uniref:Tetratricopeptide repeat protein n=1 Tax=Sphingobium nicotianae TaxID=2782607 RepID=A0A9X1IT81_9SPHN|nr:tetratricopeptide repeat protein [Sphingobium nicotianae]MBT2188954.1 tetratricopeptide repeat protein [Sphingobium nicotianae]
MNDFNRPIFPRDGQVSTCRFGYFTYRLRSRLRSIALFIALLPAVVALQACKSPQERAAVLAQQADVYAAAGNLVAARQAISQAIALREDQPAYHQLLGAIALKSNDTMGAYRAFSRALEFDATNRMALAYVANIGVQIGQLSDAEEAADKLLTLEPNAVPAMQVKGMIALSKEKYDDAMAMADKIIAIAPSDEAAAIIKARSLAKTGKAEDALKLIDAAMLVSQKSPALITNKLNIYRYLKQPEGMAPLLGDVVRLSKGNPVYRLDQVNLLYKIGQTEQARAAAMELLKAGSRDPSDYRTLQRIWWQYDKTPISEASARGVSAWSEPLAVVQTVRYLFQIGDLKMADAVLRNAPANAQPLIASLKARLFAASGRQAEARQQIDALLEKDDHDVDALLLRTQILMKANQIDAAIEAAQLAQVNDPLDPETYVVLADIYRSSKADWRARQVFEDGLKNLPQNFYLLEKYTQYLHQLGDKGRAVSVTRAFARAVPSATKAWEVMGAQCQWAGDQACLQNAYQGFAAAKTSYMVDDTPGTPPNRGLFGRI